MSDSVQEQAKQQNMHPSLLIAPVTYIIILIVTALTLKGASTVSIFGFHLPILVIWFGGLGGVVASLQGMFYYAKSGKWKDSFDLWYVFSGLMGAIYGTVGYLILVTIINAGSNTQNNGQVAALYALAAFTMGYAQRQFHAMMENVFQVIFHPASDPSANASKSIGGNTDTANNKASAQKNP